MDLVYDKLKTALMCQSRISCSSSFRDSGWPFKLNYKLLAIPAPHTPRTALSKDASCIFNNFQVENCQISPCVLFRIKSVNTVRTLNPVPGSFQ